MESIGNSHCQLHIIDIVLIWFYKCFDISGPVDRFDIFKQKVPI
jgi:hypothetical protein